ncbi:MAG: hypothetical protein IPK80_29515 [Nannocystis sp.]|jgi:hypothetical protein|nr:hypothetical protein [Nannocystis sp.]
MALALRVTSPALRGALAAALMLAGCNSDLYLTETDTTTTTTSPPVTTVPPDPWDFTTSTGDPTTGEPGGLSCRGAIACLLNCALAIPPEPSQEQDLSCFLACEEGLTAEEVYRLFKFVDCITNLCVDAAACDPDDFGGDECNSCLINNLALDQPPGCEDEGLACK